MIDCTLLHPCFDANPRCNGFAAKIDAAAPNCGCERGRVSSKSTGDPIRPDEELIYLILQPKMIGADLLKPQPALYMGVVGSGVSVLRKQKTSPQELQGLARLLVLRSSDKLPESEVAELIGVIEVNADVFQGAMINGKRKFCIYDTPTDSEPSHADILLTRSNWSSNGAAKAASADFFSGLLRFFVPANKYKFAEISGIRERGKQPPRPSA